MKTISAVVLVSLLSTVSVWPTDIPSSSDTRIAIDTLGRPDSVALDNEYIRVMHNSVACSAARTPEYGTRVIVALTEVSIQSSRGALQLKRGGIAVFPVHESYDSLTGDFFEVAFKTNHPPLVAPEEWIEPANNETVYEDEQFRVFEERLPPNGVRPLHSHAQRTVIRLNEARLIDPRKKDPATAKGSVQVPNTVKFAEPVVHVVQNISQVDLFNIVIEFKVPH